MASEGAPPSAEWTLREIKEAIASMLATVNTAAGAGRNLQTLKLNHNATADLLPSVAGKRIYVYAVLAVCTADSMTVNFENGASDNIGGPASFSANGGFQMTVDPPNYVFSTQLGNALRIVIGGTGYVNGFIAYWYE